jgi:hypothetical protein
MAEIKIPKPPKQAFNPQRPASGLLRDQVEHLEWAVRHAGERRKGYKVKPVRTEADVAARMAALLPKLQSADQLPFAATPIPGDSREPVRKSRSVKRQATTKATRRSTRKAKR